MAATRPYCLSIAGFDPSGGAGVLADIKTFEAMKVMGMGVVTGLTFQNDSEFEGVKWVETGEIIKQIEILARKFRFDFVKIGLVQDLDCLDKIITFCKLQHAGCQIIWDPILKASAGFQLHQKIDKEKLILICKKIYLITPNTDEIKILLKEDDAMEAAKELSQYCNVFLKGGHSNEKKGRDYLFLTPSPLGKAGLLGSEGREGLSPLSSLRGVGGKVYPFRAKEISSFSKHGSGCVVSSAITGNLAKGETLQRSCLKAKNYVTGFLRSTKTLLGHHRI